MAAKKYMRERHIATIAVQQASLLSKAVMRSIRHISKKDSTPVTVADLAIQALLISTLSNAFPTDQFLGEESAEALRQDDELRNLVWEMVSSANGFQSAGNTDAVLVKPSSAEEMMELIDRGGLGVGGPEGRVWIMDPIDGTATFIKGGQYAVALALVEDGNEVLGVVGCPNILKDTTQIESMLADDDGHGFLLSAVCGDGGVQLQPLASGDLPAGQFIPSRQWKAEHEQSSIQLTDLNLVDSTLGQDYHLTRCKKLADELGCARFPGTDVWSTQLRLITIALGTRNNTQIRMPPAKLPGGAEDPENDVWDYAGAHLILKESGAAVSDLDGKDIDFGAGRKLANNWGLVAASHTGLHRQVRGKVQQFLCV